jgi:hypothetical protein
LKFEETHSQEIKEIKAVTWDLESKLQKLIEVINEGITNYKQIKQTVKEWEEMQQMVESHCTETNIFGGELGLNHRSQRHSCEEERGKITRQR